MTPFRVSELRGDGTRRTLLFGHRLVLENRPKFNDLLLRGDDPMGAISLSYHRVGYKRLVELVMRYGGLHEVQDLSAR